MRKLTLIILTMLLVCFAVGVLGTTTYAEIPHQMTYQGKLVDSNGNPIDQQTVSVTFRIYDSLSKPIEQALWSETRSITPKKGVFNIVLGEVTPINNIDFNTQYYLGLQVGTDPEMSPRLKLASAAYTFNAERLNGKAVTEFSLANHTHDASNINAGILPVARGGTGVAHKTVIAVPYTGTGIDNTVIPHGLGATPAFVFICATTDFGANAMFWGKGMPAGLSKDLVEYSAKTDCIKVVDSTNLILGPNGRVNLNGVKYVALCASE